MSHHLDAQSNPILIQAGCPVLGTLIPNQLYLFTGFNQGTVGNYDIQAYALDNNTLSEHVTVFTQNYSLGGYEGEFDWSSCNLRYLEDHQSNQVWGINNVSSFPWFSANYIGNIIKEFSLYIHHPNVIEFKFNVLEDNSSIQVRDILDGVIVGNTLNREAEVLVNSTVPVVLVRNAIEKSNLDIRGSGSSTINISTTRFENSTSLLDPTRGAHQLFTSNIYSSSYTDLSDINVLVRSLVSESGSVFNIANTVAGGSDLIVDHLRISQQSQFLVLLLSLSKDIPVFNVTLINGLFQLTGNFSNLTNNITVRDIFVAHNSTVLISGSNPNQDINYQDWFIVNGSGVFTGGQGTVQTLFIENNSLLNTSGFDVFRSRLENSNSTLIANIADATKSGYVNVLP